LSFEKISFVIPCRNEAKYISETINSILNQKNQYKDIEIIVVDGLSTDGTREIISELSSKDSRVKLIDNEKLITPIALNLGIQKVSGNFIFILGAHSKIANDYIEKCMDIFRTHTDVSCAGGPINSIGITSIGKAIASAMSSPIGVGNAKHRFPQYEGYAEMACFPVFKREVFDKIGMFDEKLIRNQDDDFCFRLRKSGGKVYISHTVKSFYYVRENLKSLFKQYFEYGYWRVVLLRKHKIPIAFRQQVPFLFFLAILILFFCGFISYNLFIAFILPIVYSGIILLYSLKVVIADKEKYGYLLPTVIPVLHLSYASGFFKGIIKLFILKDKPNNMNNV
jgi:glycosyltransferase involved in cell wall biosynthesis